MTRSGARRWPARRRRAPPTTPQRRPGSTIRWYRPRGVQATPSNAVSRGTAPVVLDANPSHSARKSAPTAARRSSRARADGARGTREVRRSFLLLDYDDAVRWARTIGGALTSMEAPLAFAAENELELVHEMSRTFHSSNWLNHFHILYFEDVWLEAMRYDGTRLGHRAPARHMRPLLIPASLQAPLGRLRHAPGSTLTRRTRRRSHE